MALSVHGQLEDVPLNSLIVKNMTCICCIDMALISHEQLEDVSLSPQILKMMIYKTCKGMASNVYVHQICAPSKMLFQKKTICRFDIEMVSHFMDCLYMPFQTSSL
jgi:hypothetical protein